MFDRAQQRKRIQVAARLKYFEQPSENESKVVLKLLKLL